MNETKNWAVTVEGNQVSFTISYCIPNIESDSNTFTENFDGPRGGTQSDAIRSVVEQAKAWVASVRSEGHDLGAWDSNGNSI